MLICSESCFVQGAECMVIQWSFYMIKYVFSMNTLPFIVFICL